MLQMNRSSPPRHRRMVERTAAAAVAILTLWLCNLGVSGLILPCVDHSTGAFTPLIVDYSAAWNISLGGGGVGVVLQWSDCKLPSQGVLLLINRSDVTVMISSSYVIGIAVGTTRSTVSNVFISVEGSVINTDGSEFPTAVWSPRFQATGLLYQGAIVQLPGPLLQNVTIRWTGGYVNTSFFGGIVASVITPLPILYDIHVFIRSVPLMQFYNASPAVVYLQHTRHRSITISIVDSTVVHWVLKSPSEATVFASLSMIDQEPSSETLVGSNHFIEIRNSSITSTAPNLLNPPYTPDNRQTAILTIQTYVYNTNVKSSQREIGLVDSGSSVVVWDSNLACEALSCTLMNTLGTVMQKFVVDVRRTRCNITAFGQPTVNSSGRYSNVLSIDSSLALNSNITVDMHDVVITTASQMGYPTPTLYGQFNNAYVYTLAITRCQHVSINMTRTVMTFDAVNPYTSAYPMLFVKGVVAMMYFNGGAQDVILDIEDTQLLYKFPYHCFGMRKMSLTSVASVTTNSGVISLYIATALFSKGVFQNIHASLVNNTVVAKTIPYRQMCPQAYDHSVTSTVEPAFLAAVEPFNSIDMLPLVTAVTVSYFALIGSDPTMDRVMAYFPKALADVIQALTSVPAYILDAQNFHVRIVDPSISVRRDGPVMPSPSASRRRVGREMAADTSLLNYTTDTGTRFGLITALGVRSLRDLFVNVSITAAAAQCCRFSNSSLLLADGVNETDNVRLNIQGYAEGEPLVVRQPFMVMNYSTLSNASVTFQHLSAVSPTSTMRAPFPTVLSFNNAVLANAATVAVAYSNFTGFPRMVGGSNITYAASSGSDNGFLLAVGCVLWNGASITVSKTGIQKGRLTTFDSCQPVQASMTWSSSLPPVPKVVPRMSATAQAMATTSVFVGSIIAPAGFSLALQRTLVMAADQCGGDAAMSQPLDVFTNPTGLQIMGDEGSDTAAYGAAFRGAVVGNVAAFWCTGGLIGFIATFVISLRLWTKDVAKRTTLSVYWMEAAARLGLPALAFTSVVSPLLQPVLSSSLALALHSSGKTDKGISAIGIIPCTILVARVLWIFTTPDHFAAISVVKRRRPKPPLSYGPMRTLWDMVSRRLPSWLFDSMIEWRSAKSDRRFVKRYAALIEPLSAQRQWIVAAEIIASVEASLTAAWMPGTDPACMASYVCDLITNAAVLVAYVKFRPYATIFDALVTTSAVAGAVIVASLKLAQVDDDTVTSVTTFYAYLSFAVTAFGVVFLFLQWRPKLRHQLLRFWNRLNKGVPDVYEPHEFKSHSKKKAWPQLRPIDYPNSLSSKESQEGIGKQNRLAALHAILKTICGESNLTPTRKKNISRSPSFKTLV